MLVWIDRNDKHAYIYVMDMLQKWTEMKKRPVLANPFLEYSQEGIWEMWEGLCRVLPVRLALVNVDMPSDLAQLAQVILATSVGVPHIATYLVGQSMDFMYPKIRNKISSWNVKEEAIKWLPRRPASLEGLKEKGFRLVGTSPHEGENALNYQWGERDIAVIGGDKGISLKNQQLLDEMIKIPCSPEVHFLTTPTVVSLLTYPVLSSRGLWVRSDQ